MLRGHGGHNDDRDQSSAENKEQSRVLKVWNELIAETHKSGHRPQDADEREKRMPWLNHKFWMKYCVHPKGSVSVCFPTGRCREGQIECIALDLGEPFHLWPSGDAVE